MIRVKLFDYLSQHGFQKYEHLYTFMQRVLGEIKGTPFRDSQSLQFIEEVDGGKLVVETGILMSAHTEEPVCLLQGFLCSRL